ncbi:MAG: ABC transporter ATP-binding protein [Anaerolineales bacterium]|nr:ABC transporter ATP-binding protein [Anaerolineales bacterium]
MAEQHHPEYDKPSQKIPGGMPGPGSHFQKARIEKARDARKTLRHLLAALLPYRRALIGVVALVTISTGLTLIVPFLIGHAIDEYIAAGNLDGLEKTVLIILGAYIVSWLLTVAQNTIMAWISQKLLQNLRRDLFNHMQTLSLSFFDRHSHGDLMSRLTNDMDTISQVLSQNLTELFSGALILAGVLVMMAVINFWLTLGSMIVFPLMMWLVGFVGKRTRRGFRQYQMQIGLLNGNLEEMFSGQREVMAFGQQAAMLDDFDANNETVRQVGIRAQTYAMLVPPLMGILSNANIAIVAGLGGWMTLQGWATVGTIAAFYSYSRQFAAPLRQLGNLYNQVQAALAGLERVFEILNQEPELVDAPDAIPLVQVDGKVVFDEVNFSYVPGVPVIKQMSLQAEPGQTIALVGPTGAGKTTIINLLSRFYDLNAGVIRIDRQDIRGLKKDDLRRRLGIVLQDTFLFSESVMTNIRYGRLDATDEQVIDAARLAGADPFIRRLPQGYQTRLSERGSNLSRGQRQLLAIARAVLADPAILVLDEATSSVDTRTEGRIQEALLRLMEGRTSFVIAHRLSTIRDADKVLVIDDGRIIEQGTHTQLLAMEGFYHRLYMSQFKGLSPEFTSVTN